jgi:alpha-glucoside transport system substrate-binding protein
MTVRRLTAGVTGLLLFVAVTPACGSGPDDVVHIFTTETDTELAVLQQVFGAFGDAHGISIEVEGSREFEQEIGSRVAAGNPPDIALFPQPSRVLELADELAPLPRTVQASIVDDYPRELLDRVRAGRAGPPLAVPTKSDVKSLVWYNPQEFDRLGYEVPKTFEDFLALADDMAEHDHPPFCVGLLSGVSSGWPATDWIEDFVLRDAGPALYDRWVEHDIAFDDPRVVHAAEMVFGRWARPGYVYGGADAAAITNFQEAGWPLLDGECMMHRQASFYGTFWPDDADIGPHGNAYAFRLPGSADFPDVLLTGGQYAAPFDDRGDVERVVDFIASADFADAMASATSSGAFLSPNKEVHVALYHDDLTRKLGRQLLRDTNDVRFDASDLMPSAVGSGTFWNAVLDITAAIADDMAAGREPDPERVSASVEAAFADVEANWPG